MSTWAWPQKMVTLHAILTKASLTVVANSKRSVCVLLHGMSLEPGWSEFLPQCPSSQAEWVFCRILWWRNSLLRGTVIYPGFSTHSLWHWKLSSQASFKRRNRSYSTESQTCSARPGALCLSSSFAESELYGLACLVACFRFLNSRVTKTCVGSYDFFFFFSQITFYFFPRYMFCFLIFTFLINVNHQKAHLLNWVHETLTMY